MWVSDGSAGGIQSSRINLTPPRGRPKATLITGLDPGDMMDHCRRRRRLYTRRAVTGCSPVGTGRRPTQGAAQITPVCRGSMAKLTGLTCAWSGAPFNIPLPGWICKDQLYQTCSKPIMAHGTRGKRRWSKGIQVSCSFSKFFNFT